LNDSQDVTLPDDESTEYFEDENEDLIKNYAHQSILSNQQFRWSHVSEEPERRHSFARQKSNMILQHRQRAVSTRLIESGGHFSQPRESTLKS
jgi:hypothetical protein